MAGRQALRSLANFFDAASGTWKIPWKGKSGFVEVGVDANTGYRQRTIRNATESDVTVSVSRDRMTDGEKLTRSSVARARKPMVEMDHESATFEADVENLVNRLNQVSAAKNNEPIVINAAGNGVHTLRVNQDVADLYAMRIFDAVLNSPNRQFEIAQVRSGGQTGYDIAFIKAALANDIPVKIHAARGRGTGGFLLRRRNGRDAELSLEEYLDELEVNAQSIETLVAKMRSGVRQGALDSSNPNQVFVFGSNLQGVHGAGAAATAKRIWGAREGVGKGLTGQAYAFPTKKVPTGEQRQFTLDELSESFRELFEVAAKNPQKEFMLSPVGTGLGGYSLDEIAGVIARHSVPGNVRFVDITEGGARRFAAAVKASQEAAPSTPIRRINLDEPTVADVEQQRMLLDVKDRTTAKDALDSAIIEAQAKQLGLTETQRRRVEAEKTETKGALRDVERARRRAVARMRSGQRLTKGMEDVELEDVARYAPELLDNRPTFDMDLEMDRLSLSMNKSLYSAMYEGFSHQTKPASEMPIGRWTIDSLNDFLDLAVEPAGFEGARKIPGLEDYADFENVRDYGPAEIKKLMQRLIESPDVPWDMKQILRPSSYYTAILKADSFFPVTKVTQVISPRRIGEAGFEAPQEIVRTMRVVDESKFPGASPEELAWLRSDGADVSNMLLSVISGRFYGAKEQALMIRAADRRLSALAKRRRASSRAADEIDEYFGYLRDKAWSAKSVYQVTPADVFATPVATRFQEVKSTTSRIERTLRGRDGKPIYVSFQWDSVNGEIIPSKVFINGAEIDSRRNPVAMLEELFEIDASYYSLADDPSRLNPYHRFELAYRRPTGKSTDSLLGRNLTASGIRFDDGETLLQKFVLDTLGYRADPSKRTVNQIILEAMADLKIEKKAGKEIRTWVPRKKQELTHFVTGKPAKSYARQYQALVEQAMDPSLGPAHEKNYENLVRLSQFIGRRQLSSDFDVNFWGKELTPAYALTRIMSKQGLRNTRPTKRIKKNVVEEVEQEVKVFRSREDMPPEGPMTDDEIWYAYRVGEVREFDRDTIENVTGIRRTFLDEDDFLDEQQIVRPYRNMIVQRDIRGRQPRPPKPLDEDGFPITRTAAQKAGRILPRTEEEKAARMAKLTDEYGFSVLLQGDDVVDIMRKPGSNRQFGNPYHIDDAANIVQRVHANTKFEYYFLNGSQVEQFSPGLGKMVVSDHASYMRRNVWRLRGKKLSCICGHRYCHGEILLQYANSDDIGRLINQYGDNPALLSAKVEEALLRHGTATRRDFESYLSRYERQFGDQLTTLPTQVQYRVQADDLFIERINPRSGIEPGTGSP
jgi:hypothetical protein